MTFSSANSVSPYTAVLDAFSGRPNISLRITLSETQVAGTNRSTIGWSLQAVETSSQPSFLYDPTATATLTFTLGSGVSLYSGSLTPAISNWEYDFSASGNQTKTLGTGSFVVTHTSTGAGTITAAATANDTQGNLGSASITAKTWTLLDFSIPAVAASPSIDRSVGGTDIVVSRTTPTASTGGTQTFETWFSKNGGSYTNIGSTTPITVTSLATDYASAYVKSFFDGNSVQSSTVSIAGVPFAPSAPTISNALTTNLTLSWTAPGTNGSAITSYKIQATTNDGSTWTDLYTGITTTTKSVTNLTIGATYKFRIIAVSAVGDSPAGTASDSQLITAYGYRFTSASARVPLTMVAMYTDNPSDSVTLGGVSYQGWKQVDNVKRYDGDTETWIKLQT